MKYLYVGLLILSLLLCACYFSTRILSERTEALLVPLEQAARAAQSGDHAAQDRYLSRAANRWRQDDRILACLLSHSNTDAISDALAELQELEGKEYTRGSAALIRLIKRLREADVPRLENIF